tara:strand:- start:6126 stop:6368 length:243 start_codon:yes stop_codon:yes gene_type:complete
MSVAVDTLSKILQLPNLLTSGESGIRGAKGPSGMTVPSLESSLPSETGQNRELQTGVVEGKGYLYLFVNGSWKEMELEAV